MNIVVTGATGFIGRHLVSELLTRGHAVTAITRNQSHGRSLTWSDQVRWIVADFLSHRLDQWESPNDTDVLIHLAWPGLPNYRDRFHFEQNLPAAYELIRHFVFAGCPRVLVTGTCLEYGMQEGRLSESLLTAPTTAYGLGKDVLHRCLRMLQQDHMFQLAWARLFYLHGPGQNPKSLLAQLDAAIDRRDAVFPMSGGEQLRDYLSVSHVATHLANIAEHQDFDGTVNVCSGTPTSVRGLV